MKGTFHVLKGFDMAGLPYDVVRQKINLSNGFKIVVKQNRGHVPWYELHETRRWWFFRWTRMHVWSTNYTTVYKQYLECLKFDTMVSSW